MSDGDTRDEEPWLSQEERAMWLALSALMIRLPAALDAQLGREGGLSYFEYQFLAMLCEQPTHSMQMSELAAITNASLSRLSHVARRLEAAGFLRRTVDERDRRCTHAIVTATGVDKVSSLARGHVATVRDMVLRSLSERQVLDLNETLRTMLHSIDETTGRSTVFPL